MVRGKLQRGSLSCIGGLVLAIFFSSRTAHAAGPVVIETVFRGLARVEESAVRSRVATVRGGELDPQAVSRDLKILYSLGSFRDIWVETEPLLGGVRVIFHFVEKPTLWSIEFEGNKKIKTDKLREAVTVKAFAILEEQKIQESVTAIRAKYEEEGYFLADIGTKIVDTDEKGQAPSTGSGQAKLVFQIHEDKQIKVGQVHFIGNAFFSDRKLQKVLKTKPKGYFSWLTGRGKYQEAILERDQAWLTYHYLNHGFLKVKVSRPRVMLAKNRQFLIVTFEIEEGERYRMGEVDLAGDILTTHDEVRGLIELEEGEFYSRKIVEEDLDRLNRFYGDHGYAFAHVIPQTTANDETREAQVVYQIAKGDRIRIEKIEILGNTITRDKVIRRELVVKENSTYSESAMVRSKEKISQLGYFEEVNFSTPRGSRDDQVILRIRVKEKPTGTFSIGAGFSSAENFVFSGSIAKANFFGYGISGQAMVQFSGIRQLFLLDVTDPYFLDSEFILGMSVFRSISLFGDFDRRSTGGEMTLGRRIFENSSIRLGYRGEDVDIANFGAVVPVPFNRTLSGFSSTAIAFATRDTRDNRLFPTKGTFNQLSGEVAGKILGGDNEFGRVKFNTRAYYPVWKGIVLKGNALIGYVKSLDDRPVPLFERFFTGGVNSLRGYFPLSVGPSVRIASGPNAADTTFIIGGDKFLQFNAEVELPIFSPAGLKAVAFYDAGNAFAEEQNYSLDLRQDWGFGVRWHSPLGPLRFEWGFPIDRKATEDSVVFNFTIGSFF